MSIEHNHRVPSHRRIFFIVVVVLTLGSLVQSAYGAPIDDKRKKAAELSAKIEANGDKISALSESYNATQIQLSSLRTSVQDAQSQLDSAQTTNNEVAQRVQKRITSMYTSAADDQQNVVPSDSQRKDQYANIATGNDSSTLQQLVQTQETVSERKSALEGQLTDIKKQEDVLASQKSILESANAEQVKLLNQTKGELATLIAQQQAAQAAAQARARAAAQAATLAATQSKKSSKGSSNQSLPANLPAPSPRAAAAIEFARQQLGKPYRYGASGPDTYDCSGLTMRAYGAAGLSLPHYSGAQYAMFPKVPVDSLAPGDLVFRGAGGSAHVGIYIGNGLMINAPSTGDVVKIAPIGRTIGGARPG